MILTTICPVIMQKRFIRKSEDYAIYSRLLLRKKLWLRLPLVVRSRIISKGLLATAILQNWNNMDLPAHLRMMKPLFKRLLLRRQRWFYEARRLDSLSLDSIKNRLFDVEYIPSERMKDFLFRMQNSSNPFNS